MWLEPSYFRPGMGRISPAAGLQAVVEWPLAHRRATTEHEPDVPGLQPCIGEEQATFLCGECGYANHADVGGEINVLERDTAC